MVGSKLGHYEIVRHLGEGGMGEVYAAQDTRLNREVAIKLLPEEVAQRQERRERFEREAKTVASLSHPNIVTVHAVEEAEGRSFIVMELVRGQTLSELIPSGGMSLGEFFRIALPLADAIHAAHMRGVSHRDLKPTNVMVSDEGRVKVLDFGLAKVMEGDTDPDGVTRASSGLTAEGRILGTVAYMSPEQAEGKPLDHRSDIFSLGILLYEMLTSHRPFVGESNIATLSSILRDTPQPLAAHRTGLPLALARVVERALEKDADRRYQSAADLRRDLEDLKRDLDTGEILATASHPSLSGIESRSRWSPPGRPTLWAGGAGLLAVVAVAASLLLGGGDGPGDRADGTRGGAVGAAVGVAEDDAEPIDAPPSVAVFYFANLGRDAELDWLRTGLTDMLITQLSQSPDVRVLGTDRLHQLLEDHDVLEAETIPFDVVQNIAADAEVNRSVVGSFLREDDRLRISARVQDVEDGRVIWSETVEGAADASILDLVDTLADRIRSTFAPRAVDPAAGVVADADSPTLPDLATGSGTAGGLPRDDASRPVAEEPAPTSQGSAPAVAAAPMPERPRGLRDVTTGDMDAWKEYATALRLEKEAGPDAAIPRLEAAVEADPEFALALSKLSELHDQVGNFDASAEYAGQALAQKQRLPAPQRMALEGRMNVYVKRAEDGADAPVDVEIQALEEAVRMYPGNVAAWHDLAETLIETGQAEAAIERLEGTWTRPGADPRTTRLLADAYAATGEIDRGERVLRDYRNRRPTDAEGHAHLAEYLMRWRPERATELLGDAGELDMAPPDGTDIGWRVSVFEGSWEDARRIAGESVARRDPAQQWQGHHRLALVELWQGNAEGAVALFRAGFQRLPADPRLRAEAAIEAARTLVQIGAADAALEALDRVGGRGLPGHLAREHERMSAVAARAAGDRARSERHRDRYRDLVERGSLPEPLREVENRLLDGWLAALDGDHESTVSDLEEAITHRLGPRGAPLDLPLLLAGSLLQTGEPEEACRWLGRIVDTGPARAEQPVAWTRALYWLGTCQERLGNPDRAAEYYRRFLSYRERGGLDRDLVERARAAIAR